MFVLVYGVVAYLAFLASFAVGAAFVADVGPLRVDRDPPSAFVSGLAIDVGLLALFGVSHSIMARRPFKEAIVRVIPAAAERSTYTLVASATLALICWQWRALPSAIWNIEERSVGAVVWAVSGAGMLLAVYSTFLTDHFDLFGVRQVWLHARGRPYAPVPFKERGLYRRTRHPMMLGMLVWFWSTPTMSVGHLVFAVGMSAYIFVGVALEERDLARNLGDAYEQYRARVGRFIPRF